MRNLKKYAFLDRDGTILEEPEDEQIDSLSKFSFKPGALEFLLTLKERGYSFILVTNQDGLGTDKYPQAVYEDLNSLMCRVLESMGITFESICVCPHFEKEMCECRKPSLGMLPAYIREGFFIKDQSFVIGDRKSDLLFAKNLNIRGFNCRDQSWESILNEIRFSASVKIERSTSETSIQLELLPGRGRNDILTTIPFFDHMLDSLIRFSGFSVKIRASGDTQIDEHHLVEDLAICLGEALSRLTAQKNGITRFSQWTPMDESLGLVTLDLCGRPSFEFRGSFERETIGGISTEMLVHFFKTLAFTLKIAVHLEIRGLNTHHQCEALFKGVGLCLRRALRVRDASAIPSAKGCL